MYEHRSQPPLSRARFWGVRMPCHFLLAIAFVAMSLGAGMLGYLYYLYYENGNMHWRDAWNMHWRDALLNAAMLLGGMGPVGEVKSNGGKVFAAIYALYAGLVFFAVAGLLFTPVLHRLLHLFHWEQTGSSATQRNAGQPTK
jgi:hypothetical protein